MATACAAMPSPRPVKPSRSVVVALTLTRSAPIPRICGDPLDHRRAMRRDPRPLANDRDIDTGDGAAPRADEFGGMAQELFRGRTAPSRIATAENAADIAGADRAEHARRSAHAARHRRRNGRRGRRRAGSRRRRSRASRPARRHGHRNPGRRGPRLAGRRSSRSAAARSSGGGDLEIVLAAFDQQRRDPCRLGNRRHRRSARAPAAARWAARIGLEAKALRGLRPPQLGPFHRRADCALGGALDRIAQRRQGTAAAPDRGRRSPGRSSPHRETAARRHGSARARAAARPEPRARAGPILPRRAARDRRQHRQAGDGAIVQRSILRPNRHQHRGDPRMRAKARPHGAAPAAADRQILLGHRAAEAIASPGGDEERIDRGHRRRLPPRRPNRQRSAEIARARYCTAARDLGNICPIIEQMNDLRKL